MQYVKQSEQRTHRDYLKKKCNNPVPGFDLAMTNMADLVVE